jgi:hypothetical protein
MKDLKTVRKYLYMQCTNSEFYLVENLIKYKCSELWGILIGDS